MSTKIWLVLAFLAATDLPGVWGHTTAQLKKEAPRSELILFGGSDEDAEENTFTPDFKRSIPLFEHFEKQIFFDGSKSASAPATSSWSRAPLANLAHVQVNQVQNASEKNLKLALEHALRGPKALRSGDQLLIDINTHGTEKPHAWLSESNQEIDPRVIRPYLARLKKRGVRIGLLDESCFGGKSVALFSDLACVISSAPEDTYACGDEMQSALQNALKQKSSGVSLEDLYLSALRTNKGDSNCFGNAQFSGSVNESVGRLAVSLDNACSGVSAFSSLEQTLKDLRTQVAHFESPQAKNLQSLKSNYENSLKRFEQLQKSEKAIFDSWKSQEELVHQGEVRISPQSYYFENENELLQLLGLRQAVSEGRLVSLTEVQNAPAKAGFQHNAHLLSFTGKLSRGNFNVSAFDEAKRLYESLDAANARKNRPALFSALNPVTKAARLNDLASVIARLDGKIGETKRQAMQKSLAQLNLIELELQNRTKTIRQELAEIRQVEGSVQADRYEEERKKLAQRKKWKQLTEAETFRLERIERCAQFKLN